MYVHKVLFENVFDAVGVFGVKYVEARCWPGTACETVRHFAFKII